MSNKKVGILTLPLHTNYGGILQAYALKHSLEKVGSEVWLIERESPKVAVKKQLFSLVRRLIKKYLLMKKGIDTSYISEENKKKRLTITRQHTRRFIQQYFPARTGPSYSTVELKESIKKFNFDACVVGSDQVWRPGYAGEKLPDYFFNFLSDQEKTKKISYAASFGTSDWEFSKSQEQLCKPLLKKFDAIGVREDSAVTLCREHFDVDAFHVLDPTLLLEKADYLKLLGEIKITKQELFVYLLDSTPDKEKTIEQINNVVDSKIFRINKLLLKEEIANTRQNVIASPVEDWIKGFANAKFVVTDSFHGCAFAILFNKPFVAYASKTRGLSRFTSLLSMFGLEDRLIYSSEQIKETLFDDIDWIEVNTILAAKKEEAFTFLKAALT